VAAKPPPRRNVKGRYNPPRKEFDPKSVKQGIADPGFGRIARGAAAVGRAAYRAGSVRAAGSRTLARDAAGTTARSTGVGARKVTVGPKTKNDMPQKAFDGTNFQSHNFGFQKWDAATTKFTPKTGVGARKIQSNYPTGTGRMTNKKVNPTAVASKVPKKQRPTNKMSGENFQRYYGGK